MTMLEDTRDAYRIAPDLDEPCPTAKLRSAAVLGWTVERLALELDLPIVDVAARAEEEGVQLARAWKTKHTHRALVWAGCRRWHDGHTIASTAREVGCSITGLRRALERLGYTEQEIVDNGYRAVGAKLRQRAAKRRKVTGRKLKALIAGEPMISMAACARALKVSRHHIRAVAAEIGHTFGPDMPGYALAMDELTAAHKLPAEDRPSHIEIAERAGCTVTQVESAASMLGYRWRDDRVAAQAARVRAVAAANPTWSAYKLSRHCKMWLHFVLDLGVGSTDEERTAAKIAEVIAYLDAHPAASMNECRTACHVSGKHLATWAEDGRIVPTWKPRGPRPPRTPRADAP